MKAAALPAALIGAMLLASGGAASAAPMGFKGSWMVMADVSPNWKETWANYALTPRDAVGATALFMRSDDGRTTRHTAELGYTRLAKRWNLPEAQANVWLFGGLGAVDGSGFSGSRVLLTPGFQIDYETTRVYLAATARLYRAQSINHDFAALKAGFSLGEVHYDEVQPWAVLEVRRMHALSDRLEITPLLRLVHKRYFLEAGVNNARQARANLMYVF